MNEFIGTITLMETGSFYLVIFLSVVWSYFIYEVAENWIYGILAAPLFIFSSFLALHILRINKIYMTPYETTNVFFGTCAGSIIGLAATFLAIRIMMGLSDSRLKDSAEKAKAAGN